MTDIAMENPNHRRFLAGKIIYVYGPWLPWLCNSHNQRVIDVENPWVFTPWGKWSRNPGGVLEAGTLQESNMATIKNGCFLDDVPMNENHYESLLITIYHYILISVNHYWSLLITLNHYESPLTDDFPVAFRRFEGLPMSLRSRLGETQIGPQTSAERRWLTIWHVILLV